MEFSKATLDPNRFYQEGSFIISFLNQVKDPKCNRIINPDITTTNRPPSFCKKCGQIYCYDCIRNERRPLRICMSCKESLLTQVVPTKLLEKLLTLDVYCRYRENGCETIYALDMERKHFQKCRYRRKEEKKDSDNEISEGEDDNIDQEHQGKILHKQKLRLIKDKASGNNHSVLLCKSDHPFTRVFEIPNNKLKDMGDCSVCLSKYRNYDMGFLYCQICNYKLCAECESLYLNSVNAIRSLNPVIKSKDSTEPLRDDNGHMLRRIFTVYKFNKYECFKCRKKHLDATEGGVLHCDECSYDVCPACEDTILLKKKEEQSKLCSNCQEAFKKQESKEAKGTINCPIQHHKMFWVPENYSENEYCSICLVEKCTLTCDCDYNLCKLCVDRALKSINANQTDNPKSLGKYCPAGHQLFNALLYNHNCDICRNTIKSTPETLALRCKLCDFDVCFNCHPNYSVKKGKPIVFECPNSHICERSIGIHRWGEQESFSCIVCKNKYNSANVAGYGCEECRYYHNVDMNICDSCFELNIRDTAIEMKSIKSLINTGFLDKNEHVLVKIKNLSQIANDKTKYQNNSYCCVKCQKCKISDNVEAFHCNTCDYDICATCAKKILLELEIIQNEKNKEKYLSKNENQVLEESEDDLEEKQSRNSNSDSNSYDESEESSEENDEDDKDLIKENKIEEKDILKQIKAHNNQELPIKESISLKRELSNKNNSILMEPYENDYESESYGEKSSKNKNEKSVSLASSRSGFD